jgi:hypothetical protein
LEKQLSDLKGRMVQPFTFFFFEIYTHS